MGASTTAPKQTTLAATLGSLIGVLMWVTLAVWLISSGLPKTIGLDPKQRRIRRRIWYLLAGGGFLVMLAIVVVFVSLSFNIAAVLITWP
jgi:hypothetical protein